MKPTTLPSNIRTARERARLTADEAAVHAGVCRATWYAWESGKTDPPSSKLLAIAAALGTTADKLLRGVE
jgi:transcriptional regulator with XRE-family HTH domain